MKKNAQDFKQIVKDIESRPGIADLRELQKARMYIHFAGGKGKIKSEATVVGDPVVCEIYHYAASNQDIKNAIFQDLRREFKQDLVGFYDQYRAQFNDPDLAGIKSKLEQIIKGMERPEFSPTHKRFDVMRFFKILPASMRKRLLFKLSSVEFRELYGKAAEKFRSSYLMASFYMMDNFYPYINTLPRGELTPDKFGEDNTLLFEQYRDSFVYGSYPKPSGKKEETQNRFQVLTGKKGEQELSYKIENMKNLNYKIKILSDEDSTDSLYQEVFSRVSADKLTMVGEQKVYDNPFPLFYLEGRPFTINTLLGKKAPASSGLKIDVTNTEVTSKVRGIEGENLLRGMAYEPENFESVKEREKRIEEQPQAQKVPGKTKREEQIERWKGFNFDIEKEKKESSLQEILTLFKNSNTRGSELFTQAILDKLAQLVNPWVDAQGKTYSSEEELLNAKREEWLPEVESEVVSEVVEMLNKEIEQIPELPEPVVVEEEISVVEPEMISEQPAPQVASKIRSFTKRSDRK